MRSETSRRQRKMSTSYNDVPFGVRIFQKISDKCCPRLQFKKNFLFKSSVLALTYMAYTCYHMTRKPISVVKSVLHRNCSELDPPSQHTQHNSTWCDYPPFDSPDAATLFGTLDSAFLFCYAAAMFVSGFVAERVSLRYFLSLGMILSGAFTYLFGIAKPYNIHSIWYFLFVQACAGIFQTTGWPGVVTVVGRWFGKAKRGFIFGCWNSHTSVGNILGTLIAARYVETDWSLSFIVPGLIMGICGFILFLFLVDSPELVGCQERPNNSERRPSNDSDDESGIISNEEQEINYRPTERTPILRPSSSSSVASGERTPIKWTNALQIPGVIEFSLCLFFSKLVSYTFLYWLPVYIQSSTTFTATFSARVSTLFDVGGIIGAIAAGAISDYTNMSATTCSGMLLFAAPILLLYQEYGSMNIPINIVLLLVAGILVNGPYALITTSVSAELGTHSSLEGNSKALATVTAIIDGTGSIGAAVGPLLAGIVSNSGWQNVFYMLIVSDVIAMLLLIRLVTKEFRRLRCGTIPAILKRNVRIE